MLCKKRFVFINEWMDSIYYLVIEEDNSFNIVVI